MPEPEPPRDPRMLHTRPGPRLLALAGLALIFVFYRPGGDPGLLQSILLPLVALASTWYLTGSTLVVALGVTLIAAAHSDLDSDALAEALIYPGLALIASIILIVILLERFITAVRRRRQARAKQDPSP